MISNAIRGLPLSIYGNGKQVRDWLYVEDHANALLKILKDGSVGETYNIGGFNEHTNYEVVTEICSILDELMPDTSKKYKDLIEFIQDRPGHDFRYAIDATKLVNDLGWKPNETFSSGLHKTVRWYLENTCWVESIIDGSYKNINMGLSK
jgi:dTDP-glucose 4,6-dehydratase